MFALKEPTAAKVRTFNLRDEKHGNENVHAIDVGMRLTGPSSLLDMLHPGLRAMLYLPPDDSQATIEGEAPAWTVLRCDGVPGVALPSITLVGRTVTMTASSMESELERDDLLELSDCTVGKFHVTAHPGGSVDIDYRVQCSDVDGAAIGAAGAMLSQSVKTTVTHTEIPPNAAAPTASPPPAAEPDAGELFAESVTGGGDS